jgi:23S rRNA (cytidine1920-2'-O)/16S rRNA (cytidine1409-2'-O)-methyltransferase
MPKLRLDLILTERGLAESRAKAQAIIMAGQVRVNGQMVDKASATFAPDVPVEIETGPRFVSRGGEKLLAALEAFPVNPLGLTCADVGASTGGFTDCLLQHGAAKVYAIDVGKGILHYKLRTDPRVIVMEETNARFVESLPEPIQLIVCDASFISLKILLPVMKKWTPLRLPPISSKMEGKQEGGEGGIITLIKPQFEAGKKEVARGKGVVRDAEIHRNVLLDVLTFAQSEELIARGLVRSPVLGPKGNTEFLAWFQPGAEQVDIAALAAQALA